MQEETGACPLITPFGVHCLEKLGDTLLKNGEALWTSLSGLGCVCRIIPSVFFTSVLALSHAPGYVAAV